MSTKLKIFTLICGLIFAQLSLSQPLGRLFFTSEQRAQLESSGLPSTDTGSGNHKNTLTLNGIVQKDGGKRTAWINGVPQQVGKSDANTPGSVPVTLPGTSKPINIKVGQRVLINPAVDTEE